jgi:hypothetical protein
MKKNSVGLLELETAVLECFLEKTPLSPLGVKVHMTAGKAHTGVGRARTPVGVGRKCLRGGGGMHACGGRPHDQTGPVNRKA